MTGMGWIIVFGVIGAVCGIAVAFSMAQNRLRERMAAAVAKAKAIQKSSTLAAGVQRRTLENQAREAALAVAVATDEILAIESTALGTKEEEIELWASQIHVQRDAFDEREQELRERESTVRQRRAKIANSKNDRESAMSDLVARLETLGATSRDDVIRLMTSNWVEAAQREAAQRIRNIEQGAGDSSHRREAERVMSVAVSRYQNHFLTERNRANIPLENGVADILLANENRILDALALGANTKLSMHESGQSLRLEGLDGVGREVARRALKALVRKPKSLAAAKEHPESWVRVIRERLDAEIERLGQKAFKVLEVKRADPEIVTLVGQLNYRTSYSQNQWLHAVESAFIAGIMAEELGLDSSLARRATLMHDIGKALTYKIEGSHAVIGADIARRVGEDEIVANAIGSHHADEPANSAYAYLVAAADAISGARPGARRENNVGFSTHLQDLERLGGQYDGVDFCAAVYGGRELRVYVRDEDVNDLQAVEMSSEIASQISDELVFPGQVKVTVIRASESVALAM